MAAKPTLLLKRGDGAIRHAKIPIGLYQAGAILGFTAKLSPDNGPTDASAVIDKQFTDSNVDIISDPLYAIYTLTFVRADTSGIQFPPGSTSITYDGEFQYKTITGEPKSYPGDDNYIAVIVYSDIRIVVP